MPLSDAELPLDDLLMDFQTQQRQQLLVAVDRLVTGAIREQGSMLMNIQRQAQERHLQAMQTLKDTQPSMLDVVVAQTLNFERNSGLIAWIQDESKKLQAKECVDKLQTHLQAGQGNAFRSDFEALLVVYMEHLEVPMERGGRLVNRIEDFKEALHQRAGTNEELLNLVYRVRWACNGVRTIGNARSHDATPLSESESLELCSCMSAMGATMPTLALEFEMCRPTMNQLLPSGLISDSNTDLARLLRQAADSGEQASFEMLLKLVSNGVQRNPIQDINEKQTTPPQSKLSSWTSSSSQMSPSKLTSWASPTRQVSPAPAWDNSATSTTTVGPWGKPSPPSNPNSPVKPSTPSSPPADIVVVKKPSPALLKLVPTFKFYHDRPVDLPEENDIGRKIMFARMMNHINGLPKASLCPLQPDHDPSCALSHSILEVMTYNPLYKRMICRQPDHYWGNRVKDDPNCACVHVDTGVDWKWILEEKRSFCPLGARCINKKCVKSHSFEEMRWYNPWYKVNKCEKRVHDHIVRARGVISPPLDCIFYHIEDGPKSDKRDFTTEHDYVGKPIKMLFPERSHKPLADALEALRYAHANDL